MPVPEGQITGAQIWQSPIEPVEEEFILEDTEEEMAEDVAAFDAAIAEEQDDL